MWTCRSTNLAGTRYLSAQQPREPHLTTMLVPVASTADRLVSVQRSHCLGARAVCTSNQRCLHVNGTATPTAVLKRRHWVRRQRIQHTRHSPTCYVLTQTRRTYPTSRDETEGASLIGTGSKWSQDGRNGGGIRAVSQHLIHSRTAQSCTVYRQTSLRIVCTYRIWLPMYAIVSICPALIMS